MSTLSIGNFARFFNQDGTLVLALQNFFIGENLGGPGGFTYTFVPFGFSGLSTSRQGDLSPATLVFPNTTLSRGILDDALRGGPSSVTGVTYNTQPYVVEVDVRIVNPEDRTANQALLTYTGQASSGGWGDTELMLEISSILDAVRANIPTRTLQQAMVGGLPTTSKVRLR